MASLSGAGSGVLLSTNILSLHPLDILIFIVFLIVTLIVGLSTGRRVKTIHDYALGGKNFSTFTLVATIVATFSSGSGLFVEVENTYTSGLYFIIAILGIPISLWLSGKLVMRMDEFMGHVSIAEAMGSMYGNSVRVVTACSSILAKVGYIAIQFKAISRMLEVLFHFDAITATCFAACITILYSASGGVKAVVFTDVLQFFTFGAVIPILAIVIWQNVHSSDQVVATLTTNPIFSFKEVVGWNSKFASTLGLLLYFGIPQLYVPSVFQRIAMSRDVRQARRSLNYAALTFLIVLLVTIWIGVLILTDSPGLTKEEVIPYMINQYTYTGLKGLLAVGIMALAMSTADSSLNAISVMFAHDLVHPLTGNKNSSVTIAKAFSVIGGVFALLLALYGKDLLGLLLLCGSFYMPIFTVPMLVSVLGFRTSTRAVLLSMSAGAFTVVLYLYFWPHSNSIPLGMLVNLVTLISAHYLLGEPGGWKKIDPNSSLGLERIARKEAWQRRKQAIKNFKLYPYLQQNTPQQEIIYSLFGFYAIIATYSSLYAIEKADIEAYNVIYEGVVHTGLFASIAFLTFPIWPPSVKSQRFMTFFWPLGMTSILFFAGTLIVSMSHFHPMQVIVLLSNLLITVLLLRTHLAFTLAFSKVGLSLLFFVYYTGEKLPWSMLGASQFRVLYGLLFFVSLLVALLRGKHAYARLDKQKNSLKVREKDQQESLARISTEKQAALASFQHTGAEQLLSITRELQTMHVAEEDQERMKALQTELLPIAFHLQGLDTRARDYLRLNKVDFAISAWCEQIKEEAVQKGNMLKIHCRNDSQIEELNGDTGRLTTLLVKSIMALSTSIESQDLEDQPTIFFRIEDTQLSYPLPDVKPGYIKYTPAVRLAMTVGDDLPPVRDSYAPDLTGRSESTTAETLANFDDIRLIKSHYGYAEVMSDTFIYVVPVDVEDVRPKDMDKDYMEVGAKPKRADDHFKDEKNGIDAQVQEAAFLADVAARSDADLGMVQMALETIKWYHGPKGRNSGEPFYLHPLTVAHIVLDYNTDEETILGALLHDTVEDTAMQLEHIEAMFGKEAAKVVDVVTHLQSIEGSIYKIKMSALENLQMLDRTDRTKGLYVKIADRMHNMRTIGGHKKVAKRKLIAQETADFFVPLARKLGLEKAAAEFEKMCLDVLKQKE